MSDDDYVHSAGRVARAGRSGTAYSLVSPDEMPYLLDLHLFLGRDVKWVTDANKSSMFHVTELHKNIVFILILLYLFMISYPMIIPIL